MRNLLILVVLLLTAGTFYSALWYKSEVIENDITARVTDALDQDTAKDIAIDVDGRHVTLSGVVYDEATEAGYLDTADKTYGALGPIDGLTYQTDSGYVKVTKTADGISLRGTVPTQEARAALVANAEAAANGATVDDQLVIAGPQADWQDEAAYGLTQMAGLKEGTLMATAGAFSLSGMTDDDPDTVKSAFADRDGWETFVSAPTVINDLSGELARLNGELDSEKANVGTLSAELEETKASLSEFNTLITEQGETIQDLNGKVDALTSENGTLTDELNSSDAKIASAAALASTLTTTVDTGETQISTLQSDLDSANGTVTDLTAQVAEQGASITDLTGQIEARDATIVDLTGQVEARGLTIERLNGDVDGLSDQVDGLNTKVGVLTDTVSGLTGKVSELEALNSSTKGEDAAQIIDLTQTVAERDATIKSLEGVIGETLEEGRTNAASLSGEIDTRDATIAELNSTLGDTQGEVAVLAGQLAIRENKLSGTAAQIAALTDTVADRDQTIADLQARPAATSTSSADVAQQCAAKSSAVMEGSRINFGSGTARINADSVELLERLTGIALACAGDDLTVEIGGHTDAQGSDSDNQRLSEARANAIVAFMAKRGVPTDGLKAVGYGESKPIADNATSAGRAQNRRITFDWQAR